MSTSLLYHAFGTRGYRYVRTAYTEGQVIFPIRHEPRTCRCSACGSGDVPSRGQVERRFRSPPIGARTTSLVLSVPRVECRACGLVRQVDVAFADPRRSYTRASRRDVPELSRRMTIRDVAAHRNVGWDLVKDIQKRDLARRDARPKLKHLRHIAIDEIAVAEGHRSLRVVMDLEGGAVVFVGDGNGADALKPSRERLRPGGAKVTAVAMDMSAAYRQAVSAHPEEAAIVFDHFQVIKLFNDELSDLRRSLYHQAKDEQTKVLKGARWLLLKDPEDLDAAKDEKQRLEEAVALNKPSATAYSLKESLRRSWEQPGRRSATAWLDDRLRRAEASGVRRLQPMAETRAAHRTGLLAYDDAMITSGPLEGTNDKIKTMKRMAYGFRDLESFELRILAIHETKYALVG